MKKTYIIGLLTCLVFSTTAYARPDKPHSSPAVKLTEALSLDDTQANSIAIIFENAKSLCNNKNSRSEHRKCMREQREVIDGQISALLSEEQLKTFEEIKENRPKKRPQGERERRQREGQQSEGRPGPQGHRPHK